MKATMHRLLLDALDIGRLLPRLPDENMWRQVFNPQLPDPPPLIDGYTITTDSTIWNGSTTDGGTGSSAGIAIDNIDKWLQTNNLVYSGSGV